MELMTMIFSNHIVRLHERSGVILLLRYYLEQFGHNGLCIECHHDFVCIKYVCHYEILPARSNKTSLFETFSKCALLIYLRLNN